MKGWQKLKSYEQLDVYCKWRRENCESITEELKKEYVRFCDRPSVDIAKGEFGWCVGVPLLVVTILWIASAKTEYQWFIAAGMVGFGFLLRIYQKHIIDMACRHFFWDTKRKILYSYLDRCKVEAMALSTSTEDVADIDGFFEYCRSKVLSEDFCYYGKDRSNAKRKNK